jgi:hypothetical protein
MGKGILYEKEYKGCKMEIFGEGDKVEVYVRGYILFN